MNDKFIKIDISTILFQGLSAPSYRKFSMVATFAIWVLLAVTLFKGILSLEDESSVTLLLVAGCCLSLFDYIVNGRFLPHLLAVVLVKYTPLAKLYRHDKGVLNQAKTVLLKI